MPGGGKGCGGINIPSDYKLALSGSIDADLDNIHIREIAPINSTLELKPIEIKPLTTTSTLNATTVSQLEIKPLNVTADTTSQLDIKPMAVDSCMTIKLAPLPPICGEHQHSQHIGFTFLGIELWGMNFSGTSRTSVRSPPKSNHYIVDKSGAECSRAPSDEQDVIATPSRSGLRVR